MAIAAGVLIGAFVLWSKYSWDTYQTSYEGWRSSMLDQTRDSLALPVANDQERQAKFIALKKTAESIVTAKQSLCTVNTLVGWQRFIAVQRNRERNCQTIINNFATFADKLKAATIYLESDQALAKLFSVIPPEAELTEADWAGVSTGWHTVVSKVDALTVNASFRPTKQAAHAAAEKVDAAWQEVLAASVAKDKARYEQAQEQLVQSYRALGTIQDTDAVQLKALLDPLQSAYSGIINA